MTARPADTGGSGFGLRTLAFFSAAAGGLHIAALPSHRQESSTIVAFFVAVGLGQLAAAVLLVYRPSRRTTAAVVAGNLAIVGVWVMSRTVGVPFGAHRGQPEPVSVLDGLATALELAVAVAAVLLARQTRHHVVTRSAGRSLVGTLAALWLVVGGVGTSLADSHHQSVPHHEHPIVSSSGKAPEADAHQHPS